MRANTTHIDKYGVTHEIRLIKSGYGGASTELRGTAGFVRFQHDNLSEANPFATPIQNARLEFGAWIESVAGDAVIDELMLSQEGDWQIEWYQNSVLFWKGIIEPDLTIKNEGSYPYEVKITAKDMTYLSAETFDLEDNKTLAIEVLARALNSTGFNLPVHTRTSWVCEDTDTAEDFLRQVYVQTINLRDYGTDNRLGVDDVPWTMLRVVEEMARAFKLFIRQTNGVWLVEQMSAHSTPASVLQTVYDSAGAYQSDSNVNPVVSANTTVKVVQASTRQTTDVFGFVQSTYEHRSRIFGIRFLPIYDITAPLTFGQRFIVDGTQAITFTGTIQSKLSTPLDDSAFTEEPYANVEIRVGDLWWDGVFGTSEWVGSQAFNRVRLLDSGGTGEIVRSIGSALRENFAGSFNIITAPIPVELTAGDTLSITIYPAVMPIGATTRYNGLSLEISNNDSEKASRSLKYELSQTGDFSLGYDDGVVYFGSGPTTYSPGALLSSSTAPDPLSNSLITNWNRRGTSPDRIMALNVIKEVLDQTRGYRGLLEAEIRGLGFNPNNTLSYDSKNWFYIGGTFDAYTGDWTVVLKENSLATATDTQATVIESQGANVTSSILQAVSSARNEAVEASAIDGMRLALEASGTISQIQVYDRAGYVEVKEGQVLRIVNPVTLTGEQVTASADRSGDVITVDSVTLSGTYPAGCYVFLSAESLSAGIAVGENAVRIYAEGQKVGRLSAAVDGNVTSLVCTLYTKVVKGTELQVVNSDTGQSYSVTVDDTADTYGPGDVTLSIEEQLIQAPTGAYIVGDNAWQSSAITVTQGLIVLKVDSSGRVAQVKLSADQDSGSEIDISAEQVKINGIIFTEGADPIYTPGDIATSNYSAGVAGWKIDGDGSAEFNNVTVRGSLQTSTIDGDLTMDGGAIKNTADTYRIDEDGISFEGGTYNAAGSRIIWNDGISTEYGRIVAGDISGAPVMAFIGNGSGYVRISVGVTDPDEEQIKVYASYVQIGTGKQLRVIDTTDATSKDTGAVVVEGGVGIEKNAYIGGLISAPSVTIKPITDSDSPYTVLATDTHIAVDNNASAVTVNLPTGTDGRKVTIYDRAGTASLGTITINRASTNTINGSTSTTLTSNYQSVTLVFYSGNWTII